MIIFSGCGFLIVVAIYAGSFWTMSKVMAGADAKIQVISIVVTMAIATAISYLVARLLNRKEVKHTIYGAKLQNAVLAMGAILEFLALMMLWGEIH